MNIIVCTTLVRTPEKILFPQDSDFNALEEAVRIRERSSGKVIVLAQGCPDAMERERIFPAGITLERGADVAIIVTPDGPRALAEAIRRIGTYSLVLFGQGTADANTNSLAVEVAEALSVPCITDVEKLEMGEMKATAMTVAGGAQKNTDVALPCVITVTSTINQPRVPGFWDSFWGRHEEVVAWDMGDSAAGGQQEDIATLLNSAQRPRTHTTQAAAGGMVFLVVLGLVGWKLCGEGTTPGGRYKQTWTTPYSATTCSNWSQEMTDRQKYVMAGDMYISARKAKCGSAQAPSDSRITEVKAAIEEVCAAPVAGGREVAEVLTFVFLGSKLSDCTSPK